MTTGPLDLPTPGADASTWGTKLNNALNGTGTGTLSATYAPITGSTEYAQNGRAFHAFAQPARGAPVPVTQFDSGHGWTMGGTGWATSNLNDTADFATGTQSVRWTTKGDGTLAYVQRTGLTLDLTDKHVRVWFKVDDFTNSGKLEIILGDSALANYYWSDPVTTGGTEAFRIYKAGEWFCVTVIPDMMNVTGAPNRAAINVIRIIGQDNAAGAMTVHVDRVETIGEGTKFPSGVISLTFDDSYASHYTIAMPKLSQYGYLGTLFPINSNVGLGAGWMTQAQLDALTFVNGWEVGAHATTGTNHGLGLNGMTQAQRIAELRALRKWQNDHGYNSDSFAWPNGSWDLASVADVRPFYATARVASRDMHETQFPTQPYRIRAINPTSQTLAQMQNEVAKCKVAATWAVFVFHDIVTTKSKANDVATADFQALVDYINSQGVPVRTVGEVTRGLAA